MTIRSRGVTYLNKCRKWNFRPANTLVRIAFAVELAISLFAHSEVGNMEKLGNTPPGSSSNSSSTTAPPLYSIRANINRIINRISTEEATRYII